MGLKSCGQKRVKKKQKKHEDYIVYYNITIQQNDVLQIHNSVISSY